jgi:DNA-binding NarL/FixJ family response regulator
MRAVVKRFLIADDHEVVRSGLRAILEARTNWVVCAEATNGQQVVELGLKIQPDLAILDYSMPTLSGLEAGRRLRSGNPSIEVLLLTMHEADDLLPDALGAGIHGILFKSDARTHLISAIEALLEGQPYFSGPLVRRLLSVYETQLGQDYKDVLTARERDVVKLIADGHTNKAIGANLKISIKTVETHRASVMRKLGLSSTAELVRYAIRKRLITP